MPTHRCVQIRHHLLSLACTFVTVRSSLPIGWALRTGKQERCKHHLGALGVGTVPWTDHRASSLKPRQLLSGQHSDGEAREGGRQGGRRADALPNFSLLKIKSNLSQSPGQLLQLDQGCSASSGGCRCRQANILLPVFGSCNPFTQAGYFLASQKREKIPCP